VDAVPHPHRRTEAGYRSGLTVLSAQECHALLAASRVGRVLVSLDAMPAAFPVNYAVLGDDVVFRTAPGTKLSAAVEHTVLGFEVDDVDFVHRCGWSVLAVGMSRVVTDEREIAELDGLELDSWWSLPFARYVRIEAQRISGRRVAAVVP
jgi:nitroimidazol reductase NimA-like FMN-containing flavoprotein (pyridoxamine 5'-phosphate oxidase superfamily)